MKKEREMNNWAKVDEALEIYTTHGWGALTEEQKREVGKVLEEAWKEGEGENEILESL